MSDAQLIWLTALSGLELLVLLVALGVAVWRIQVSLEGINVHASKILWGVRAIERETDGLRDGLPQLRATLTDVVAGAGIIADRLTSSERHLASAAETLSAPRGDGRNVL
ncbi:MAG: hypothetical protein H0T18_08365 [Chloroflexia bacterium]|nr:hypothetical protein [Chloroflexia bacterium]